MDYYDKTLDEVFGIIATDLDKMESIVQQQLPPREAPDYVQVIEMKPCMVERRNFGESKFTVTYYLMFRLVSGDRYFVECANKQEAEQGMQDRAIRKYKDVAAGFLHRNKGHEIFCRGYLDIFGIR